MRKLFNHIKAKICNLDRYNTIPMKNYITVGIAALGLIIAAAFLGNAIKNRNKSQNTISVTGLGAKKFTSDLITWSASFPKVVISYKKPTIIWQQTVK